MSDHWEYYPTHFDDGVIASVVYDHGIGETIKSLQVTQRIRFKTAAKFPTEEGQPGKQENDFLEQVEDAIEGFAIEHGGIYVGRMTYDGARYFYTYVDVVEKAINAFLVQVAREYEYKLEVDVSSDPDKSDYWTYLFPDENTWQWIIDTKVINRLKEAGDSLTVPRPIDHFAEFDSTVMLKDFVTWAKSEGFSIVDRESDNPQNLRVQFSRDDLPRLPEFNQVTCSIRAKCQDLNGSYDGWESWVVKDSVDN